MPLSEHEQRLFEQIERSLAEDPKFASAVRASDPRFHARRRLLVAAVLVVAGLGLVVYGAVSKGPLVGVAGFALTLRGGRGSELRSVGGTARRAPDRRVGCALRRTPISGQFARVLT